jgi:hypothetical protein
MSRALAFDSLLTLFFFCYDQKVRFSFVAVFCLLFLEQFGAKQP